MVAFVLAFVVMAPVLARAQGYRLEFAIEATYLYKFVPFIEWPQKAESGSATAIVICVIGTDPFGGLLEQVVAGKFVDGHPFIIRHAGTTAGVRDCSVLYAGGSSAESVPEILRAVRGTPVLTVTGEVPDGEPKGIVNFVLVDNHVGFEIDDAAAAANGLVISSKLLSLAVRVVPRAPQE